MSLDLVDQKCLDHWITDLFEARHQEGGGLLHAREILSTKLMDTGEYPSKSKQIVSSNF